MELGKMTKKQLIAEVSRLREQIEEFQASQEQRKQVEKALQENEGRYRTLAEAAQDFIYLITPDMRLEYINAAGAKQYKVHPEGIIGKPLSEIFPPEIYERQQRNVGKVFQTGEHVNVEHWYEFPTGGLWLSIRLVPITNESGEITYVLGISRDITERKQAQQALKESEQKYRALIENTNDIAYHIDAQGVLIYLGPQVRRYGIEPEEALSAGFWEFIFPEDREKLAGDLERTLATGEEFPTEFRLIDRDGHIHWLEEEGKANYDESGKITGISGMLRDITGRKRAEEALRESKERLSVFMESALDAFALFDSEMNLVEINKAGLRFLGADTKKEDVIGKNIRKLYPGIEEEERYDKYLKVIETGKPLFFDAVVPHQQSGNLHLTVRIFKVIDGLGMIVTDITEQKEFGRRIVEAHEEERRKISGELHDNVGQLLTAAKMRIDRLRDTRYDNMAALTKELSEVSHILSDVLEKTRDLSHRLRPPLLDQLGLVAALRSLATQFESNTGAAVLIETDRAEKQLPPNIELLIYRVVQEALTNVARHAAASKVRVRLTVSEERIELSIGDNGKGFDVAAIARRTDCMGVRSMREKVTNSGGAFRLDSEVGKGTTLQVTLPHQPGPPFTAES